MAANQGPVTVRLFPLWSEHGMPMIFDLAFLIVLLAVWTVAFGEPVGASALAVLGLVVLFHCAQVWWLVVDRFDDDGVTIIRPWRRLHVPWTEISGLVYSQGRQAGARGAYALRLVLKDDEPPLGRYLSPAELQRFATGPVVMLLMDLEEDLHRGEDNRSVRCTRRVFAELERHGLAKPSPHTLSFRLARYAPEELALATAIDTLKLHPVTVTHGPLDDDGTRLLDTDLAALARDSGPLREINRESGYAVFSFEAPDAATTFSSAARALMPYGWSVAPGALPVVKRA